jgi:hypothetical protein
MVDLEGATNSGSGHPAHLCAADPGDRPYEIVAGERCCHIKSDFVDDCLITSMIF